ncbi:cysteine-rich DPF motif domain-containing protein 1 isoform X3 [Columba livia]|uniref:cysteine-rich DPF motif domain-containing protein 1 isoform X3 n=1 Tax=Columba livia TaxID=8932 RepID=UPI0031BAA332
MVRNLPELKVRLLEECYVMKDPFTPDKDKFLILGSHCSLCNRSVCVGTLKVLRIPRDKKQWALEVVQLKSSFRALQTPRPHTDAEREGAWQSVQKRTIDEEKLFLGLESRAEAGCL